MTSLPSGLASISSRLDDAPNVRGAVAFGRMVREREEVGPVLRDRIAPDGISVANAQLTVLLKAIDRHAQLAVSAGYRSADRR